MKTYPIKKEYIFEIENGGFKFLLQDDGTSVGIFRLIHGDEVIGEVSPDKYMFSNCGLLSVRKVA